uniref:CSON004700 protein n=1 Tax=Culicoides sonorensis TaxID=179676 RepID=A0A336M617_CULSO
MWISAERVMKDERILSAFNDSIWVRISPGSHVVKLPMITRISRLACDGSIFKDLSANSSPFCNEGSPVHINRVGFKSCWLIFSVQSTMMNKCRIIPRRQCFFFCSNLRRLAFWMISATELATKPSSSSLIASLN